MFWIQSKNRVLHNYNVAVKMKAFPLSDDSRKYNMIVCNTVYGQIIILNILLLVSIYSKMW